MRTRIDKTYPMPCSPEIAWEFLQNVEAVTACMPGAQLTERVGPGRYKGSVTAKVGPATMSFKGEVEMKDVDAAARSLRLLGKGTDSTGSSSASMDLNARIDAAPEGLCALVGASEVSMNGKAAAFGGRLMTTVADQILKQFADNFAAQVGALQGKRSDSESMRLHATASAGPSSRPVPTNLNVLALGWNILKDWLRGLFSRKPV